MPADLFTVLFFLVFFLALAIILVQLIRGIAQWGRNNASPRLTVDATVVSKREQVWHSQHNHGTAYYATFQVESGDRMELPLQGIDYGQIAEGDRGRLTFQGTRFLAFERY